MPQRVLALQPQRDILSADGQTTPVPGPADLFAPQFAAGGGWWTRLALLNAETGDIDQLTFAASRTKVVVSSWAANWQGFLFDNSLVATYGYRHDKLKQLAAGASTDRYGIIEADSYELDGATPRSDS